MYSAIDKRQLFLSPAEELPTSLHSGGLPLGQFHTNSASLHRVQQRARRTVGLKGRSAEFGLILCPIFLFTNNYAYQLDWTTNVQLFFCPRHWPHRCRTAHGVVVVVALAWLVRCSLDRFVLLGSIVAVCCRT